MKVLAINGSPRRDGNTNAVMEIMGKIIQDAGIDFEILHIGNKNIRGCVACDRCIFSEDHLCAITDDEFKGWQEKIREADGVIFGCPTYFHNIPGTFKSFLDRLSCGHNYLMRNKVATSFVTLRRSGGSMAYAELLHYLAVCDVIMVPSRNFNIVHGALKGEVIYDHEGLAAMEDVARSMVWLLNTLTPEVLQKRPEGKPWEVLNFIRDDLK